MTSSIHLNHIIIVRFNKVKVIYFRQSYAYLHMNFQDREAAGEEDNRLKA